MATIVLVAALDLWIVHTGQVGVVSLLGLFASYVIFIGLFYAETIPFTHRQWPKAIVLLIQMVIVVLVFTLSPNMFTAILLVIWSSQLPYFMPFRYALWSSPLWSAIPWTAYWLSWGFSQSAWMTALLFYTFNLFALVMMESRRQAELERARAEQANRELRAMQSLLQEASKQDERMRIARDIHDVVGHHLAALALQLQVLSRTVDEQHVETVNRAHTIAKLLLSDVRTAVSDMRARERIDLARAIHALVERLDGVDVELQIPAPLEVPEFEYAMTVLRSVQEAITNSLRHGHAYRIVVRVRRDEGGITTEVDDIGRGAQSIQFGHGLLGMQERIQALGGTLAVIPRGNGVCTKAYLPLPNQDTQP